MVKHICPGSSSKRIYPKLSLPEAHSSMDAALTAAAGREFQGLSPAQRLQAGMASAGTLGSGGWEPLHPTF